jgi:DNA-binding GntR family transcriptional regulator
MKNSRERPAPETIAESLRAAIHSGVLAAGTQLRQDHIAEEHGVSHIPVREALRRLESEGLVTYYPRRGAFVAQISATDAAEITEMRVALEALALRRAIQRATAEDRAAAEVAVRRAEASSDLSEWSALNWEFHRALYGPCSLPRLLETIEGLWRNVDRYIRVVWQVSDYAHRPHQEHRQILAAYRPESAERCVALMTAHILGAHEILVAYFKNDLVDALSQRTGVQRHM